MVVSVLLYPLFYGLELFLASALITQIAVSLAAVVVSSVTIYYCRQQLIQGHQERVIRSRGRWQSDVSIKSSKRQRDSHRGSESSEESEESDSSMLRRLRAGLQGRGHDRSKSSPRAKSFKPSRQRSVEDQDESKKESGDTGGRARSKLTKQAGAMHRSHWVAKPQQSLSSMGRYEMYDLTGRRRSSESDPETKAAGGEPTSSAALNAAASQTAIQSADSPIHPEPETLVATEVVVGQPGGKSLKRSRATARMTLKKHPRFSSSDSSSSSSPASSSAESDDLVHGEAADKPEPNPDTMTPPRRVPSIQVEPIFEERFVPPGRHFLTHATMGKSSETEISTLEFSLWPHDNNRPTLTFDVTSPSCSLAAESAIATTGRITVVPSASTSDLITKCDRPSPEYVSRTPDGRRDRLGVPPVIACEDSYPEGIPGIDNPTGAVRVGPVLTGSLQRPLRMTTPDSSEYSLRSPQCDQTDSKSMDSLDVPTIDVCFPLIMLTGTGELTRDSVDTNRGHTSPPVRKILKIRPKSLDIPPILPASYPRGATSEPTTPPSNGHGVKRKHSGTKSILKLSSSIERPGRKKSVTFSPEVSPREFSVEARCYRGDVDREQTDTPKRPRVFRHFSMDIPDARMSSSDSQDKSPPESPRCVWSTGDCEDPDHPEVFSPEVLDPALPVSEPLSRVEGWIHPSSIEPVQVDQSSSASSSEPDGESDTRSAKERFLAAGGAKAVLSVLCTQDSSDSNGGKYTAATVSTATSPDIDESEQDSMETMPDVDDSISILNETDLTPASTTVRDSKTEASLATDPDKSDTIKSRFLEFKEDSTDLYTSRLFEETVRSSVESNSSDELDRSPTAKLKAFDGNRKTEQLPDGVEEEEDDEQGTSAKSRFLQSCQKGGGSSVIGGTRYGSRFVVSLVRPSTLGGNKQDPPANEHEVDEVLYEPELKSDSKLKPASPDSPESELVTESQTGVPNISFSGTGSVQHDVSAGQYKHCTSKSRSSNVSENLPIVIDNGSSVVRVGFAGDVQPRFTLPSAVGQHRDHPMIKVDPKSKFVGQDIAKHEQLLCDWPSSEGIVHNWNDMELIWEHIFTSVLSVACQDYAVLISDYASAPMQQREKYLEVLFEKLHVGSLCLVNQGTLALHAHGGTSGIVLSSGAALTEVIPVVDGQTLANAVTKLEFSGNHVTQNLGHLLQSVGGYETTSSSVEDLTCAKERLAYVCMDFDKEMQSVTPADTLKYELPDGHSLSVGTSALFRCTEPLFRPSLVGLEDRYGVHDMIQDSLKRCDPNFLAGIHNKSILLCGGNTKLTGFGNRLQRELASALLPWSLSMPEERIDSAWLGGSVLASHGNFSQRCISLEEYAEHGASVIHSKYY